MIDKNVLENTTEEGVKCACWNIHEWYYASKIEHKDHLTGFLRFANIYTLDEMFQMILFGYTNGVITFRDYRACCMMIGYIMKHYYHYNVFIRARYFAYRVLNVNKNKSIYDII